MSNCETLNIGEPDMEKLDIDGEKVKKIRKKLGLTQAEVKRLIEKNTSRSIGPNAISELEKGGLKNIKRVEQLATVLAQPISAIVRDSQSINRSSASEHLVKISTRSDLTEDKSIVRLQEINGAIDLSQVSRTADCKSAVEQSHSVFRSSTVHDLEQHGAPYDESKISDIPNRRDAMFGVPGPTVVKVEVSSDKKTAVMDQAMAHLHNAFEELIRNPYVTPGSSTDIDGAYNSTTLMEEAVEKLKALNHGIRIGPYDFYKETYINPDNTRDYLSDGREFSEKMVSLGICGLTIYRRWTCLAVYIGHKSHLKHSLYAEVQVGHKAKALQAKENLSSSDENILEQLMWAVNPLPSMLPILWPNTDNSFELDFYTQPPI